MPTKPALVLTMVLTMILLASCKFFNDKQGKDNNDDTSATLAAPGGDPKPGPVKSGPQQSLTYIPKTEWNTREQLKMIPALLSIQRIAKALGISSKDDVFQVFQELKYLLGEVDYSSGMVPNLSWDPTKINRYLNAVKPVCHHKSVETRLNAEDDHLAFMAAAYGRSPTAEEQSYVKEFMQSNEGSERKKQLFCMAVLTSVGFVAQ